MNIRSLVVFLAVLAPTVALAQSTGANGAVGNNGAAASSVAPVLNEETRLYQQFAAKRDAMEAARAVMRDQTKNAKTDKEKNAANDEIRKIESDFLKDNADLIARLKAIDDQKRSQRPAKRG